MIKLAIFDLDQTLINTLPRFHKIFNLALKRFGCKTVNWDTFVKKYRDDTLNDFVCADRKEFWDYFLRHYNDLYCEKDTLIDGALETLRKLKDMGVKVAVTTGRIVPEEFVWDDLRRFGLDKFVDYVTTRYYHYGDGRKRTEMLLETIKRFNARPEETVFVGDYWPDMISGKEAGVFTVGVLTGHEDRDKLKKYGADVVIDSVKELPRIIENLT